MARGAGARTSQPFIETGSRQLTKTEQFDLRGINTTLPHDVIPKQQSPYLRNVRMFAQKEGDRQSTIITREGPGYYTDPVGEALSVSEDTQDTSETFEETKWLGVKFTPATSDRLTKATVKIRDNDTGTGTVLVRIHNDDSNSPGTVIATSSILNADMTSSYQKLECRFIEAPEVATGSDYWITLSIQPEATGNYEWGGEASGAGAVSIDGGNTWSANTITFNYEVFLSDSGPVKGLDRFRLSNGTEETLFAHDQNLYTADETDGSVTSIQGSLTAGATLYQFAFANDTAFIVNGNDAPKKYDGTTVSDIGGSPVTASQCAIHQNRLFLVDSTDPTRIEFSGIADFETYDAENFLYVPAPKTSDPITGIVSYQNNLVIFTKNTKYVLSGSDLATFTLRQSTGKKGAVGPRAITTDGNYIYFLSDDNVYRFNGSSDDAIGANVLTEINGIANPDRVKMHYHDRKVRMYYPSSGTGYNDRMMLWDFSFGDPEIFIDDNAFTADTVTDENGDLLQGHDLVGQVMIANQDYSDMGKPIAFEYRTRYMAFNERAARKQIRRLYPFFRASPNPFQVTVGVDTDFADSPTEFEVDVAGEGYVLGGPELLGEFTLGQEEFINPRLRVPGNAQYYQIRFTQNGVGTPVSLLGYSTYSRMRRPK